MAEHLRGRVARLEYLCLGDAADILSLRNDPQYNRYLSHPGQTLSLESQEAWLKKHLSQADECNFKILVNERFVGTISLYSITEQDAEFGRYLAKNPIASLEAEWLLLKHAFERLGLSSVYCKTLEANPKVWKQHQRFGFQEVGTENHPSLGSVLVHQVMTREDYLSEPFSEIQKLIERFS